MPSLTKYLALASAAALTNAYFLMGLENPITIERLDPIVNPGTHSSHVHTVFGGSNFGMNTNTARLRQSQCTSIPIPQDKSNYWIPTLYFEWANGSFSSVSGGAVVYYLFDDKPGTTTAFPDDFRMLSGDPMLRTYDPNSHAQQAVTFLCLDFNGVTTRHNEIPSKRCPSGVRSQINFQSCWDGKNVDSPDHKSHVAYQANGPDSGGCKDPNFPITIPRVFMEMYQATNEFDKYRSQAKNPDQPFVFSNGDPTGYGYHGDFFNGWDSGVLQKVVDGCNCNIYGDPQCCADKGIFNLTKGKKCFITPTVDEPTTGMLPKLPGNNPVQPAGKRATAFPESSEPPILAPVRAYTDPNNPAPKGQVATPGSNNNGGVRSTSAAASSTVAASTTSVTAPSTAIPSSSVVASLSTPVATSFSVTSPAASTSAGGNTFIAVPSNSASTAPSSSVPAASPSSSPHASSATPDLHYPVPSSSSSASGVVPAVSSSPIAASSVASPNPAGPSASGSVPGNPYPYPVPSTSSTGSGSDSGSQKGPSATSIVLAPAASSPVPSGSSSSGPGVGPVVPVPSKGNSSNSSTKNGAKCKHRDDMQKQFKQLMKTYHSEHAQGSHQHGKRVFSHDLSAGRRRFAQSRMLVV